MTLLSPDPQLLDSFEFRNEQHLAGSSSSGEYEFLVGDFKVQGSSNGSPIIPD
jgi:hypothetical protein